MELENIYIEHGDNPTLDSVFKTLKDSPGHKYINIEFQTPTGRDFSRRRTKRKKDIREFVKIFSNSKGKKKHSELSLTAQKVLWFILDHIMFNTTYVYINPNQFMTEIGLSRPSLTAGVKELLLYEWLYKSNIKTMYWINLHYVCKGNIENIYYNYIASKG